MNKRELIETLKEIAACIAFSVVVVLFFWLYLIATPDQMSGEYDKAVEEAREAGIEIGGVL